MQSNQESTNRRSEARNARRMSKRKHITSSNWCGNYGESSANEHPSTVERNLQPAEKVKRKQAVATVSRRQWPHNIAHAHTPANGIMNTIYFIIILYYTLYYILFYYTIKSTTVPSLPMRSLLSSSISFGVFAQRTLSTAIDNLLPLFSPCFSAFVHCNVCIIEFNENTMKTVRVRQTLMAKYIKYVCI